MSTRQNPDVAESRTSPPSYAGYTAILLTALVASLFGLLAVHGIMLSKIEDAPSHLDESLSELRFIGNYLSTMNNQLSALNSAVTRGPLTVTVEPASFAVFTMTARP